MTAHRQTRRSAKQQAHTDRVRHYTLAQARATKAVQQAIAQQRLRTNGSWWIGPPPEGFTKLAEHEGLRMKESPHATQSASFPE